MGLYAGDRAWTYNYGIFDTLRDRLADKVGIEDRQAYTRPLRTEHAVMGFWLESDELDDDILFLLTHSDCNGIFMPYTSEKVAARLKDILARNFFTDVERIQLAAMLDLLEWASGEGVIVEFA